MQIASYMQNRLILLLFWARAAAYQIVGQAWLISVCIQHLTNLGKRKLLSCAKEVTKLAAFAAVLKDTAVPMIDSQSVRIQIGNISIQITVLR